jgi:uncharacterized membrane protein
MHPFDARSRWWLLTITALAAVFVAGTVAVPWIEGFRSATGGLLRLLYSPACHQMPDRCLDLGFGRMAVCARCTGLYIGGLLGMLIVLAVRGAPTPRLRWLVAAAIPTVVDFALGLAGLPSLSNWPRLAVAIPPGLLLGLALADAIVDLGRRSRKTAIDHHVQ